jgi:predicted dehydrogenase
MLKVGLVGCGHIAETYFRSQKYFNNIEIISCADINAEASKKCAQEYNIEVQEVDDLLADKKINIVLNLTTPQAHYELIKKTLLA